MLKSTNTLQVESQFFALPADFSVERGEILFKAQLAYETYGKLNADASNAILVFHALSGSQHVHGYNPSVLGAERLWQEENHLGWWDAMIGAGKPLDTDKYFIICANYLGSCYGSTGPTSPHPQDNKPWGSRFPRVTVADQARAQDLLLTHLGIDSTTLVGPSVGGLIALAFCSLFPARVKGLLSIGAGSKASTFHRLSLFEQILAIELDPAFCAGNYSPDTPPTRGLALARIIGHKSFVYQAGLEKRAKPSTGDSCGMLHYYPVERNIQSYMLHQGTKFARRFDANSYIRIADMWLEADIATMDSSLRAALNGLTQRQTPITVFSIDSDECFLPQEQNELVRQLQEIGLSPDYHIVKSAKGHDSFLLEPELYAPALAQFLQRSHAPRYL